MKRSWSKNKSLEEILKLEEILGWNGSRGSNVPAAVSFSETHWHAARNYRILMSRVSDLGIRWNR